MFHESQLILRNRENYLHDVTKCQVSETGIHVNSIWNDIATFHVTENYSIDMMHDLFEGVCHYDLRQIINNFIDENFFTLDLLNERKYNFHYGPIDVGDIFPDIEADQLNRKKKLRLSAIEMATFCYYF